jgi:hypothetical protein
MDLTTRNRPSSVQGGPTGGVVFGPQSGSSALVPGRLTGTGRKCTLDSRPGWALFFAGHDWPAMSSTTLGGARPNTSRNANAWVPQGPSRVLPPCSECLSLRNAAPPLSGLGRHCTRGGVESRRAACPVSTHRRPRSHGDAGHEQQSSGARLGGVDQEARGARARQVRARKIAQQRQEVKDEQLQDAADVI